MSVYRYLRDKQGYELRAALLPNEVLAQTIALAPVDRNTPLKIWERKRRFAVAAIEGAEQ